MQKKSIRYEQRRTSVPNKKPSLTGLLDGELYLNTHDGVGFFKNTSGDALFRLITDSSGNGLNYLKFSGANSGDIAIYNGSGFYPLSISSLNISGGNVDLSSYVTTGQTGNFLSINNTGSFVSTGQTGNFLTVDNTGDFVITSQTGDFVSTAQTGNFLDIYQTGNFVSASQTGNFLTRSDLTFKSGEIANVETTSTVTGLRYFNSNSSINWYSTGSWYADSGLNNLSNDFPLDFTKVVICGNNSVCVNLDSQNWTLPRVIDSTNISSHSGIRFYSNTGYLFTGNIIGNATFIGNVAFGGNCYTGDNFNNIICRQTVVGVDSFGANSYLPNNNLNTLEGSTNSAILNGYDNLLSYTSDSAIIGSCIHVISGETNTLYVNNICSISGGKITADSIYVKNIYAESVYTSGGQGQNNDLGNTSVFCDTVTLNNNSPTYLNIKNICYNETLSFSACIVGAGTDEYFYSKIDGMLKRKSEEFEISIEDSSLSFTSYPSNNLYSTSSSSYCVTPYLNKQDSSLKMKIVSDETGELKWFVKVDMMSLLKN